MTGRPLGYSTGKFAFAAGHRYHVSEWTPEQNQRVFGPLTVPHGHNYTVITTGENLARVFWRLLEPELPALCRVAVVETAKNRFEYSERGARPA
jgi:6-pyruvoyl-tetrahydropterin synthase